MYILVMGVSGSGKTTIAKLLSEALSLPFLESDSFHSSKNIDKMKAGIPLEDEDRIPWLKSIHIALQGEMDGAVLACSALKEKYREILFEGFSNTYTVFLDGTYEAILGRMQQRSEHFMPPSLLRSQFKSLEIPNTCIKVGIEQEPSRIVDQITSQLNQKRTKMLSDIGIIGLGVMGSSLARNFASKGIKTSVYNMPMVGEEQATENFIKKYPEKEFYGASDLVDFVRSLSKNRLVLLMIKSGDPVDEMIDKLIPLLDKGDSIIDAGNSFYKDTERRSKALLDQGFHFVGMGVSGGEEGALNGPSIMPAGSELSKNKLLPLLRKIAAVSFNEPCVDWVGKEGAGHFVKMVHNGIEYADMQLLSEVYGICRFGAKMDNEAIANLLESKCVDFHEGYLLEITIDILRKKEGNAYVLDEILDVAGHKGTGMWTSREALELGVAVPTITAAMNQRIISSYKDIRTKHGAGVTTLANVLQPEVLESVVPFALLAARLIAHAEGFHLMQVASDQNNWDLDMESISKLWRGGCIIRSAMLPLISKAYRDNKNDEDTGPLEHLLLDDTFGTVVNHNIVGLSGLLSSIAVGSNIATPCLSAAHNYYRSFASTNLPINMIQAQRDYFGAHTYRTIKHPDQAKHTNWK